METLIEMSGIRKEYRIGEQQVHALDGVDFSVRQGEMVAILGPSGSGKSTLMNLLGCLDTPDSGTYRLSGQAVERMSERQLSRIRGELVGFVFQGFHLLPGLTALENVEMAARLEKGSLSPAEILREVGLGDRLHNFPAQLSGGEQQRVAIARALVKNPRLLLCDEPTGALDYETGKTILSLLQRSCRDRGTTAVIITHNHALCPMADKVIRIKNGTVVGCECNADPTPIEQIEW